MKVNSILGSKLGSNKKLDLVSSLRAIPIPILIASGFIFYHWDNRILYIFI